ncbi:MAG: hypothetical protein COB53_06965 [Elusimicrobia bacterium]|nr:MAG: hypothetical protein COB53_06965 [Elusimicrobiota bacterium]
MSKTEKIILAVGLAAFGLVAFNMPWSSVELAFRSVGFGFILIFAQEMVAHLFNTLGWWTAFLPEHRGVVPSFWRLLRLRIAGDGVHYLMPSAVVAGEVAKASMIGKAHPMSSRVSSLVVSKLTQLVAFVLVFIVSLLLIFGEKVSFEAIDGGLGAGIALLSLMLLVVVVIELRRRWLKGSSVNSESVASMINQDARKFFGNHPGRFAASVFFFALAYLWGAFEAYWIAHFLGLPITVEIALMIEILSTTVDGIFFMVPAKAGTQEVGKTAIFVALGLPKTAGFAFGLIRHAREILWAIAGLGLFYREKRRAA